MVVIDLQVSLEKYGFDAQGYADELDILVGGKFDRAIYANPILLFFQFLCLVFIALKQHRGNSNQNMVA